MRLPWGCQTKPGRHGDGTADPAAHPPRGPDRCDSEPIRRAHAGASADLSGPALPEGAGDHAGAGCPDGRWTAGDPRAADPGDAGVARAADVRRAVPDPPDLGTAVERFARDLAGPDR